MSAIEEEVYISTQIVNEATILSPEHTMFAADTSDDEVKVNPHDIWGLLRRKGNMNELEDIKLVHRIDENNRRDTYTIGRNLQCDVVVDDRRISSFHCLIYCDYTLPKLRVFIEDTSANGTFVNFSLKRLSKGERLELKSGDEIYLLNPRNLNNKDDVKQGNDAATRYMFFNMRDRLFDQREVTTAPIVSSSIHQSKTDVKPHIEDVYVIGNQVGAGTCGQVYKCIHRVTGKQFAVKIIDTTKFSLIAGLSIVELRDEAAMMKELHHPNIIRVEETFETETVIFIVMELVRGGDLFDRIMERGKYTEDVARELMRNILSAVKYLHSNNIIHRDLKPENILLTSTSSDTDIKISDFGLAKRVSTEGLKTFCGTPIYFAPEVLRRQNTVLGMGRYGTAADLWSIGVILYILLSGTFPFDEANLFDQIQYAQYSLSGTEWNKISESAKHLIRSLMTLRPEHRVNVDQALAHPWITHNSTSHPSMLHHSQSTVKSQQSIQHYLHSVPESSTNIQGPTSSSSKHQATTKKSTPPVPSTSQTRSSSIKASKRKNSSIVASTSKPDPDIISSSLSTSSQNAVPIGNVFWSIRSMRDSSKETFSSQYVAKNKDPSPPLHDSDPIQPQNPVSLFGQVMGIAQLSKPSTMIHGISSTTVEGPASSHHISMTPMKSKIPSKQTTSKLTSPKTVVDRTSIKRKSTGVDHKDTRASNQQTSASATTLSSRKKRVKTIHKEPGLIVHRYSTGSDNEDEYRELLDDHIEECPPEGDDQHVILNPSDDKRSSINRSSSTAKSGHHKQKKDKNMTSRAPTVYSLEKAWKLDQLHENLPSITSTSMNMTHETHESSNEDQHHYPLQQQQPISSPEHIGMRLALGSDRQVAVSTAISSPISIGHGNGSSNNMRKQSSKRKLRQPVKSMADLFKRRLKK